MRGRSSTLRSSKSSRPRVLVVENNVANFNNILRELERAKLEVLPDRASDQKTFLRRLMDEKYDAVIAGQQTLKGWTGMDALQLMREHGKNLPFLLFTGNTLENNERDYSNSSEANFAMEEKAARWPEAVTQRLRMSDLQDERKQVNAKLRESEAMFRTLAETIHSAIFVYLGTHCRYANRQSEILTGYSREEILAMSSLEMIHPDSRESVIKMGFTNGKDDTVPRNCEAKIVTKSGKLKWLEMTACIIEIEGKRGGLITAHDISERKKLHEEMKRLITSDPLTGLANYRRLEGAFESELERARRTGRTFSLLLLDLDGLKKINDVHGHVVGSRALCRVADVLQRTCRHMDVPSRYGGDEFAVILPETEPERARVLADRLARMIQDDHEDPAISVSYGVSACPRDGNDLKELLRIADGGLYAMKAQ